MRRKMKIDNKKPAAQVPDGRSEEVADIIERMPTG